MMRTTINLPISLHHRLQAVAQGQRKTLSSLVRDLLEKAVAQQEAGRLDRSYQALRHVKGIAKGHQPDASSRINELLYGPTGAWRGK